jgi:hypothetical protein
MAYDPTTPSDPYNHAQDTVKAKSAKPQKRYGDESKTVAIGRPIYVFPAKGAPAEREDKS